jgi:hypothetical protein
MTTYTDLYQTFLSGNDTLQIYRDGKVVFSSDKDRLIGLMQFINGKDTGEPAVIFDKVMGNAAALLAVKAKATEVFSPLGSDLAIATLKKYNITYHLSKTVPHICRDDGKGMCPMEALSINKTPEEFYLEMQSRIAGKK